MKTDENFYDIINSKFNDREIPFDEDNWQSMRKMIDDSRSEKRRNLWLVLSLCALLFTGATWGIYEWNSSATAKQYTMIANNNSIASSTETTAGITKQSTGQITPLKSDGGQNANEPGNVTTTSTNTTAQIKTKTGLATNNRLNKISKKNYLGKSSRKNDIMPVANPLISMADNANNKNNGASAMNEQTNQGLGKTSSLPLGKIEVPSNSIAIKSTGTFAKTKSQKPDSSVAAETLPKRFSDEPRIFNGKTNIFSLEAGGEYSFGWAVNTEGTITQGEGLNYMAGLGYEHYMGSKLFLKTGVQFSTFGNMHTATYNYQHNVGNIIYDSVITTKRLYFIKIPVQVEYFIGRNKKSSIGGGGSVWFLIGNRGYATTYQQGENTPPMNVVQYSQNASLNGYTNVDFSADAFYRYMINPKFSLYFTIYSEFTSMREKSFFGESVTDNTRGCQFTLSYNLN